MDVVVNFFISIDFAFFVLRVEDLKFVLGGFEWSRLGYRFEF